MFRILSQSSSIVIKRIKTPSIRSTKAREFRVARKNNDSKRFLTNLSKSDSRSVFPRLDIIINKMNRLSEEEITPENNFESHSFETFLLELLPEHYQQLSPSILSQIVNVCETFQIQPPPKFLENLASSNLFQSPSFLSALSSSCILNLLEFYSQSAVHPGSTFLDQFLSHLTVLGNQNLLQASDYLHVIPILTHFSILHHSELLRLANESFFRDETRRISSDDLATFLWATASLHYTPVHLDRISAQLLAEDTFFSDPI